MLYVFVGKDIVAVRGRVHEFLGGLEERHGAGVVTERITSENYLPNILSSYMGASLFGGVQAIVLDTPSENPDALEEVLAVADALAMSENIFVLMDTKPLAAPAKVLKKYASEYVEIAESGEEKRFNTFALADALMRKDKKSLWVLFVRAKRAGIAPEEIAGVLFWQIKVLRLAGRTKNAKEAGMKDFSYRKAKNALAKFREKETDTLSRNLVRIYHDGHLGKADLDLALEKFVLSL